MWWEDEKDEFFTAIASAIASYIQSEDKKKRKHKLWRDFQERNEYVELRLMNFLKKDDLLSEYIGIHNSIIMIYVDQYMNTQLNIDKLICSEMDFSTIF